MLLEETSYTAFHPTMLMKITLYAYFSQVFSEHKIVQVNEEVIPMKLFNQDTYVNYKTINNTDKLKRIINFI